jgi:hypothetical protein
MAYQHQALAMLLNGVYSLLFHESLFHFFFGKNDNASRGLSSLNDISAKAGSTALVGNGAALRGFALDVFVAALAAASREAEEETSSPCSTAKALGRGEAALTLAAAAGCTREIAENKLNREPVVSTLKVKASARRSGANLSEFQ